MNIKCLSLVFLQNSVHIIKVSFLPTPSGDNVMLTKAVVAAESVSIIKCQKFYTVLYGYNM